MTKILYNFLESLLVGNLSETHSPVFEMKGGGPMAAYTSPGNGTTSGPGSQTRTRARAAARQQSTQNSKTVRQFAGGVVIAVLVIAGLFMAVGGINGCARQTAKKGAPAPVETTYRSKIPTDVPIGDKPDGPVDPAVPGGVMSWHNLAKKAQTNPEILPAGEMLHPTKFNEVSYRQVLKLEEQGQLFKVKLPKGTHYVNTDYNVSGDGKWVYFYDVLTEDTWFLALPDGTIIFKMKCGNAVLILDNVPAPKQVAEKPKEEKKKEQKKSPYCAPPKGAQGDPEHPERKGSIGQKVSAHKSSPTKTGSSRGTVEVVTKSQEDNTDTDAPVTGGANADDKAVIDETKASDGLKGTDSDGVVTD